MTDLVLDHVLMKHCVEIVLSRSCDRVGDRKVEEPRNELPSQILFFVSSLLSVFFILCTCFYVYTLYLMLPYSGLFVEPSNH